ncbi:MAG: AraC family ligand binding domain-containing protein, partial [Bacteroidota bacterium]
MSNIFHVRSISEIHSQLGLPKPKHPLVSVITDFSEADPANFKEARFTMDLYSVSLKSDAEGTIYYGRNTYDFQEGTLIFLKPNQVIEYEVGNEKASHERAWTLFFHPDLIHKSELGAQIDSYS